MALFAVRATVEARDFRFALKLSFSGALRRDRGRTICFGVGPNRFSAQQRRGLVRFCIWKRGDELRDRACAGSSR